MGLPPWVKFPPPLFFVLNVILFYLTLLNLIAGNLSDKVTPVMLPWWLGEGKQPLKHYKPLNKTIKNKSGQNYGCVHEEAKKHFPVS